MFNKINNLNENAKFCNNIYSMAITFFHKKIIPDKKLVYLIINCTHQIGSNQMPFM